MSYSLLGAGKSRTFQLIALLVLSFWFAVTALHDPVLAESNGTGSVEFVQVDFASDYSGDVPCSEYGQVDMTVPLVSGEVRWLQVVADLPLGGPAWVVRNMPLLPFEVYASSAYQTGMTINLSELGVSRGHCIAGQSGGGSMEVAYDLHMTTEPISVAPGFVGEFTTAFGATTRVVGGVIPAGPIFPGVLPPPDFPGPVNPLPDPAPVVKVGRSGMGNVEQGKNECAPGGVANSMHWLDSKDVIDLGTNTPLDSLGELKTHMIPTYTTGPYPGVNYKQIVEGKLLFAAEHGLDLDIHYQADSTRANLGDKVTVNYDLDEFTATRDGGGGKPTWDYLVEQMKRGQDVELVILYLDGTGKVTGGHLFTVTEVFQAGSERKIKINDDGTQGAAGGLRTNLQLTVIDKDGYIGLKEEGAIVSAIFAESVSLEGKEPENINGAVELVKLVPEGYTYHPVHGFEVFHIIATFKNKSHVDSIIDPFAQVAVLSGDGCPCEVLNRAEGDGGVGSKVLADKDVVGPGEEFTLEFYIGLYEHVRFTFFVDILGIPVDP